MRKGPERVMARTSLFLLVIFLALASESGSATSTNVPVGSPIYDGLERLEVKGLLGGGILTTKPISRGEVARLAREAEKLIKDGAREAGPLSIVESLRRELSFEMSRGGDNLGGGFYLKTSYRDGRASFASINDNGYVPEDGAGLRGGAVLRGGLYDTASLYLNPEYRLDEERSEIELLHGYAVINIGNLELLIGRDSIWWGPGRHGGLIMTNNAKPFDMVKVSSQRHFILPWAFKYLGVLRPAIFLARLEEERDYPHANLLGMRVDLKPAPYLQAGLSRVIMFGGEGRKALTPSDWAKVFIASDGAEHADSPINGNQIIALDLSYVYVNRNRYIPFAGVKLYTEWGAEDSSGNTKTPSGRANIYGMYMDEPFRQSGVDLRVEWANTARSARYGPYWYTHGVYTSGYTHEGRVIGHHMGGDSRDLFLRLQYHMPRATLGVEADIERSGVHSTPDDKRWLGFDVSYDGDGLDLRGNVGFEDSPGNVFIGLGIAREF
ncbi:MAG TPA: hypothetical protein DDW94_07650 [Deltaproteobacteria bacterium]|nr:MAG: hypothetical protein A2Z79_02180 [Deltaproteobacteria bacterium GWA2_55_82]OGQ62633.1 MAG: hypothetical protein A3I81_08995 [Deltaproteobacteria bacterium RIFCSPLOWO2_02_FULL_55_12]OIJ74224.1 MAG: hypothetical protein A2V21_308080 [Deltaproteobacteria bacterium GWC2_55_46]HBG46848.1 hypothetical protein [Deltaproteobacteria bacterium]HCY11094.1 hypothetical protein [Deltaproteobacteria bacterium]